MLENGLVHVYTGKAAQMNLAHIGLSLRATGQKLRVFFVGLLSHPYIETEDRALSFLTPNIAVERLSFESAFPHEPLKNNDRNRISGCIDHIRDIMVSEAYDVIILENIIDLVEKDVLPENAVLDLIANKPAHVELVLTGMGAGNEIIEKADLVTEMIEHKRKEGSWKIDGKDQEGCVGVVTGNGKGKTTYCLGRAMFFAASGIPSTVLQFIKSPHAYGEVTAIERFPNLQIKSMGEGFIFGSSQPSKKHVEAARHAWEACLREIFSLQFRLVVLDEINVAIHLGLVHPERVREMMFLKPQNLHLILSGRHAHPEIMEHASAVFEMKEIKHPFHRGVQARRGVEY